MANDNPIEALTLEINATSASAEKAVDKLISTLERLENKTANLGLGNVGTQLNGIRRAAAGFGEKESAGLERIIKALDKLQQVSTIKISSSVANQLTKIGQSAVNLNGVDFTGIQELSSALGSLGNVGEVNISSALNQLNRIPKIAESLNSADIDAFARKIREVTDALKPLATEMEKVSKGFSAFPEKLQRVIRETDKLPASNEKAAKSYNKLQSAVAKALGTLYVVERAIRAVAKMIELANDQVETTNLFNVAMGEYADNARAYADAMGDAMGISPTEWMRNQGVIMTLATGFGVAGESAASMSQNLTQLAYDLASFYNISTDDAFQKIQSGLAGEIEPMRRLGYDLSNAALQQIAYSKGIDKTVSSMTQAEKAQLRYYAMMTQVNQVHGDLARTIDSPANQLRRLKTAVTEAARSLGNLFIPLLNTIIPLLIEAANRVRWFADSLARLLGIDPTQNTVEFDNVISGAVDSGEAFEEATEKAEEFKKMLLGIDELNVLNERKNSVSTPSIDIENAFGSIGNIWDDIGTGTGNPELEHPLALTIKDVFFDWDNLDGEDITQKIITGANALLGAVAGWTLFGIHGIGVGIAAGTVLSLIMSSMIFDHDGELDPKEILSTVAAIMTAALGGHLVFKAGYFGKTGWSVGAFAGIALFAIARSLEWRGEGGFDDVTSGFLDLVSTVCGGLIGFTLGGPAGAKWGATIGLGLSFMIKTINWSAIGWSAEGVTQTLIFFLSTIAGGFIGFKLGGPAGLLAGAAIGAVIGLAINFAIKNVNWEGAKSAATDLSDHVENEAERAALEVSNAAAGATKEISNECIDPIDAEVEKLTRNIAKEANDSTKGIVNSFAEAEKNLEKTYTDPVSAEVISLLREIASNTSILSTSTVNTFAKTASGIYQNFTRPVRNSTRSLSNDIATSFNRAAGESKSVLEKFAGWYDRNIGSRLSKLGGTSPSYSASTTSGYRAYATGGFPQVGEMFIARERGPELVGRIGNQSAVANNNQIIAGIKQGVYEAMLASGGGERDINVYLSGKQVMTTVAEEARMETKRTGVNPLTQGI